ncbi:DUF2795 domain-containing protein [Methanosarcina horonobensis]|uniref:DUF2795 domain-containing protein n=1 Tax=Methanosarcina horonobensis TaxID=418008 RepID=UPI00064F00F3|nr:DUF2795 domain-containing protein [Methanosarcina horonobensis]
MQASYVEVRNILKNLHFPLTKKELIQQALKHGADNTIMEDLKSIPDREYTCSNDVVRAFGGK